MRNFADSLLAVCAAILALLAWHLRRPRAVAGAFAALTVGLLLLIALMRAFGIAFNMLNVVVLPTLLGVGIDNALHLLHAHRALGPGSLGLSLRLI